MWMSVMLTGLLVVAGRARSPSEQGWSEFRFVLFLSTPSHFLVLPTLLSRPTALFSSAPRGLNQAAHRHTHTRLSEIAAAALLQLCDLEIWRGLAGACGLPCHVNSAAVVRRLPQKNARRL